MCGVGGVTIAQAQRNISMVEFSSWCKYRAKYGTLDVRQKMEHIAALIAWTVASGHPRKPGTRAPKFEDFLPVRKGEEKPLTLEQAMGILR